MKNKSSAHSYKVYILAFAIFCLCMPSLGSQSCIDSLSPIADFSRRNENSDSIKRFSFIRRFKNTVDMIRLRGHITRTSPKARVRKQCYGYCSFTSTAVNLESYLIREGRLEKGATLLDSNLLMAHLYLRYHESWGLNPQALPSILSGATFTEALNALKLTPVGYLTTDQVEKIEVFGSINSFETGFLKWVHKQLKRTDRWDFARSLYAEDNLRGFITEISGYWQTYLKNLTGVDFELNEIDVSDLYINRQVYLGGYGDYSDIPVEERPYALRQSFRLLDTNLDDRMSDPERQIYHVRDAPLEQRFLGEAEIVRGADFVQDILKRFSRSILGGEHVTLNLRWSAETGFHTERHAITLTGVVINPETNIFEGFIYQNSHSPWYGLLGEGFLSRKDFEDSMDIVSSFTILSEDEAN